MAGSGDSPKRRRRGRPKGAVDPDRDYNEALAKMRAMIAAGVSRRAAAEAVGAELRIPASTLRKHLDRKPAPPAKPATSAPILNVHRLLAERVAPASPEEKAERLANSAQRAREREERRRIRNTILMDPSTGRIYPHPKRRPR